MDAIAVCIIIFAVLVLAAMSAVGGYTLGRTRAADDAKKAEKRSNVRLHETLVYCKDRVSIVSALLSFETELAEQYRTIAIDAIAAIPDADPRKKVFKASFEKADGRLRDKLEEVKG